MAETGRRPLYNIIDLVSIAKVLRVDFGTFLTEPVPGVSDDEQQRMLALLREAIVDPGGRLKIVNRRDAMTAGGLLAVTLATSYQGWFEGEAVASTVERGTIDMGGVRSLRTIVGEYRRLDDTIGPEPLRPGVATHLHILESLRGRGSSDQVERELGRIVLPPSRSVDAATVGWVETPRPALAPRQPAP